MRKLEPPGICDLCKNRIRDNLYTNKGTLRRYCSRQCRNTANSRAGADIKSDKAKERVRLGTWVNPGDYLSPEQRREAAHKGGQAAGKIFREQVKAGTWRNPAMSSRQTPD